MIAIFSDTHSPRGHELEGEALSAAREADVVIHAGDFTSTSALEAFEDECDRLFAVHGNADSAAVRDRLPTARTVDEEEFGSPSPTDARAGRLACRCSAARAVPTSSSPAHPPADARRDRRRGARQSRQSRPTRGNRLGFAVLESRSDGFEIELHQPDGTPIDAIERSRNAGTD